MTPTWQKDLDALVEQAMAFANSVKGKPIQLEPTVEPVVVVVEQALAEQPKPIKNNFAPMTWPASERDEIKQRVANFKAHQLRMQTEREGYYLKTMSRTRAIIEGSR